MATDNKSNTNSGMTVDEVISIIKAVSDSNIENFEYTSGDNEPVRREPSDGDLLAYRPS